MNYREGGYGHRHAIAIDRDEAATWRQLRDRLAEIRAWAETENQQRGPERFCSAEVLRILNRPAEHD